MVRHPAGKLGEKEMQRYTGFHMHRRIVGAVMPYKDWETESQNFLARTALHWIKKRTSWIGKDIAHSK